MSKPPKPVEGGESLFEGLREILDDLRDTPAGQLMERADEARSRLIKTAVVFFVIFGAVVAFAKPIFAWLKRPLLAAVPSHKLDLHFTSPLEVFMAYVKVGFLTASVVALPVVLLQIWAFIKPSLPAAQRRLVVPFFVSGIGLFSAGVAFCYVAILPQALTFLLGLGGDVATPLITVDDYIDLVVFMALGFGAVFQLPLVLIVLERLGVVSVEALSKNRGAMLVGILVVAAVATPTPDPFSQLAIATPMYVMFEGSILIIRWMNRAAALAAKEAGP